MKDKINNIAGKIFNRKSEKMIKVKISTKIKKKLFTLKTNNYEYLGMEEAPKTKKIRNPGIDLGRILSMYAIIIHHILAHGKAIGKYTQYANELNAMNIIYHWHVSAFIFISGYVGYKTCKYSNLLYLWLCTSFYLAGINIYFNKFKPNIYKKEITYQSFFPVLNFKYWYFTVYFAMYLFLPVINKGIENLSKYQLRLVVISLILVYIILKDYINPRFDIFQSEVYQSVIWFLIYFITGAHFGKFKQDINWIKKIIYCSLYIFIYYYSTYLCINLPNYQIQNVQSIKGKFIIFLKSIFTVRINSFTMILQSASIILFLTTINYNKYIAKVITFIGPLTYGIYLIHDNIIIREKFMQYAFQNYSSNLPLNSIKKIIYLKALKIFVACAIIEYLRNLLFRILFIRKICILFEKLIFIIF